MFPPEISLSSIYLRKEGYHDQICQGRLPKDEHLNLSEVFIFKQARSKHGDTFASSAIFTGTSQNVKSCCKHSYAPQKLETYHNMFLRQFKFSKKIKPTRPSHPVRVFKLLFLALVLVKEFVCC